MKIHRSGEPDNRVGGLALDSLVDQYWEAVYRLVYHLCGRNLHDAQDLAQETFLKAIAARASFRPGTNLKAWLLRIASNAFLDQRRRKTAKAAPLESEPAVSLPDSAEGGEVMQMVSAAIDELDDVQRTVFLLRTQDDLSFREIASMLDTTEETARWHMLQARRKLMSKLEGKL